jgi:hypothetical protein
MSYAPYQRNTSGIVFFGKQGNQPTFYSDSNFLVQDGAAGHIQAPNLIIGDGGNIGSVTDPDSIAIASNGNVTMSQSLSITGDLTVNGTTTTVNSTVVTIEDPIIILGQDSSSTNPYGSDTDDNKDRGVAFAWNINGNGPSLGFFGHDDSIQGFTYISSGTVTGEVFSGSPGWAVFHAVSGNLVGDVTGNADTATTLETTRTFAIAGEGTAAAQNFNGSQNVSLSFALGSTAITNRTEAVTPDNADLILVYDDSTASLRKMTRANFVSGYVPYTGATADLDLGAFGLSASTGTFSGNINTGTALVSSAGVSTIGASVFGMSASKVYIANANNLVLYTSNQGHLKCRSNIVGIASHMPFVWGTNSSSWGYSDAPIVYDLALYRDGAGALGLRNGANAQAFSTYSTYTSATSFESLKIQSQTAGSYQIGSAIGSAGGTNRDLQFGHWDSAGTFAAGLTLSAGGEIDLTRTWTNGAVNQLIKGVITPTSTDNASTWINLTSSTTWGGNNYPSFTFKPYGGAISVCGSWGEGSILLGSPSIGNSIAAVYGQGLRFRYGAGGTILGVLGTSGLLMPSSLGIGFSGSNSWPYTTALYQDAAGILAQRLGTNAQTFRVSNTYTSATSYETLQIQANTGAAYRIGSAIGSAGGTNRDLELGHWDSAGTFDPAISIRPGSTQTLIHKPMSPTLGQWAWTWGYHNGGPSVYGGARTVGNNMVLSVSGSAGKIFHIQNGSGINVQSLSMDTGNLTLTGDITLPQDPTSALHAATKQYVDTSRMYSTEEYASTASYNYFGFTTVDGFWKVNRFDVTTGAKTTAQDSNNGPGTYADLTAAWVDYLTLVYT